jgi:hypothetical protein
MAAVALRFDLVPKSFILKTSTIVLDQEKLILLLQEIERIEEEKRMAGNPERLALYLVVEKL